MSMMGDIFSCILFFSVGDFDARLVRLCGVYCAHAYVCLIDRWPFLYDMSAYWCVGMRCPTCSRDCDRCDHGICCLLSRSDSLRSTHRIHEITFHGQMASVG